MPPKKLALVPWAKSASSSSGSAQGQLAAWRLRNANHDSVPVAAKMRSGGTAWRKPRASLFFMSWLMTALSILQRYQLILICSFMGWGNGAG